MINIFAEKFSPTNIDKADGTPLRLYTSDHVKIDVSKRRKHDMGFWHRNIDAHEIIFCVKGALKWETEMGVKHHASGRHAAHPARASATARCCARIPPTITCLIELKISDRSPMSARPSKQEVGELRVQYVDLVIANIDWLITVDPGRRIIRDAALAVKGGKIVAVGKSCEIAKDYAAAKHGRRATERWRRRASSMPPAFLVPALARAGGRGQCAGVPVRAHVSLRGRARRRRRAPVGDAGRRRAAQARRHLFHRSRQLSSGGLGRRRSWRPASERSYRARRSI